MLSITAVYKATDALSALVVSAMTRSTSSFWTVRSARRVDCDQTEPLLDDSMYVFMTVPGGSTSN